MQEQNTSIESLRQFNFFSDVVKISHCKIASVKFESRDLASLETVMNIDEIRGLIFSHLKTAILLLKNMF
mgnify:CR=1 FL=1